LVPQLNLETNQVYVKGESLKEIDLNDQLIIILTKYQTKHIFVCPITEKSLPSEINVEVFTVTGREQKSSGECVLSPTKSLDKIRTILSGELEVDKKFFFLNKNDQRIPELQEKSFLLKDCLQNSVIKIRNPEKINLTIILNSEEKGDCDFDDTMSLEEARSLILSELEDFPSEFNFLRATKKVNLDSELITSLLDCTTSENTLMLMCENTNSQIKSYPVILQNSNSVIYTVSLAQSDMESPISMIRRQISLSDSHRFTWTGKTTIVNLPQEDKRKISEILQKDDTIIVREK